MSVHNKTDPDNTMLAKEREIEEKHKAIMKENKLRLKKQQEAAELAKLQKEEQERRTLELKKQNQQQLYNQYFKPYNNNKDKIERSLSRGRQSSKNTQRPEQPTQSLQKPGLPPQMPRSSSKPQITNIHQKPPLPQPTETHQPRDYGSNIVKNQWLDKYAGDMKDLLGLEMSGTFEQMEQMVNEEFEHATHKPQDQMLYEDKYTEQPSLDLTSIKHESGPEGKVPNSNANNTKELKVEPKDIGAKIFDCDVSVIPNKYDDA